MGVALTLKKLGAKTEFAQSGGVYAGAKKRYLVVMQSIYVVLSGALVALLFTGGMMFSKKPEERKLGMNAFLVITVLMAFLWYFGSNSN